MKFRIYRNLNRKGIVFSIQQKTPKGWRVVDRIDTEIFNIELNGISSKVYESGRNRVISEKKKYVHAFIVVDSYIRTYNTPSPDMKKVLYNPFKYENFKILEGEDIKDFTNSRFGYITANGVMVE